MIRVVEARFFRDEGEINALFFTEDEVLFQGAGVVGEVAGAVKLNRIDEDRDSDRPGRSYEFSGLANECQVSLVQGPHGRDESERDGLFCSQLF